MEAPGLDGFTTEFFQASSDIIRVDILNDCPEFLSKSHTSSPHTKESRRPKCSWFSTNRLLCIVLYKINSKLLANKLKCVIAKGIQGNQSSFVAGRQSCDNVIFGRECLRYVISRKKLPAWAAIKLALSKLYDRLRWDFIYLKVQRASGFSVEWLSRLVSSEEESRRLSGLCIARNSPSISHLFFTDDILIFCQTNFGRSWKFNWCSSDISSCVRSNNFSPQVCCNLSSWLQPKLRKMLFRIL